MAIDRTTVGDCVIWVDNLGEGMKIRVICLSKALEPYEVMRFLKGLTAKIDYKFVYSGKTLRGLKGIRIPKYYVVRIPEDGEKLIRAHEMAVEEKDILKKIPENQL